MVYMLWYQEKPVGERVKSALEHHAKKYGAVPQIIETPLLEEVVEGMNIVTKRVQIPKNHLLIGFVPEKEES